MKRVFNILINADTERTAIGAIAQKMGGPGAHVKARERLDAIKMAHPLIVGHFGSGAGLRLQRRDADITERVMLGLIERGIIVLPIRDSFIVQARHVGIRDEIMEAELNKVLAASGAGRKLYLPKGYIKKGLHKEAAAAAVVAAAAVAAAEAEAAEVAAAAVAAAEAAVVAAVCGGGGGGGGAGLRRRRRLRRRRWWLLLMGPR